MAKKKKLNSADEVSQRKRRTFINVLRRTGQVSRACEAAGYRDSTFLRRLYHKDEDFAKEWNEAMDVANDMLESEAIRRATDGVVDDVYYQGEVVGQRVNYSDNLLVFLLRGANPKKYRENINIDGEIRHKVGVALLPMTAPDVSQWQQQALALHEEQKLNAITLEAIEISEGTEVRRA